jgi:2,5-diamino-6-(ribosylamino)-4(3H)-pyrimidinone 5'-phosphate reductase
MRRPEVTINCAASIDGKISTPGRTHVILSGAEDMRRVMRIRRAHDAIAVGVNTVISDNPSLTVRGVRSAKSPVRVIFDSRGRTPPQARVLDGKAETIIFTAEETHVKYETVEVIACGRGRVDLARALSILYRRGVRSLLVEGGGELIFGLVSSHLVDTLLIYTSPVVIGGKASPTIADGAGFKYEEMFERFRLIRLRRLGTGYLAEYRRL